jgi:hypothetical protein
MVTTSIRERVAEYICDLFCTQEAGQPSGTDPWGNPTEYDFKWSLVQREPLADRERMQRYAMAVLETAENKDPQVATMHAQLNITLEFWMLLNADEAPAKCANVVLLNIQRRIREDITLGGLVYNVRETGNIIDVDGFSDRLITGAMFLMVLYKHAEDDPRRVV